MNISRRDFLKGSLAGAAAVAATSVIGVSAFADDAADDAVVVPEGLTEAEVKDSVVELGAITPDEEVTCDIVVVGAGAAGTAAACYAAELGADVALLQKESIPVSQGGSGSCILLDESTPRGVENWIQLTNDLCDWRCDRRLLRAYAQNSEEAVRFMLKCAGLSEENEWTDGNITATIRKTELKDTYLDRYDYYDFGEEKVTIMNANIGPKPKNVGTYVTTILNNETEKLSNLKVYYSTPAVQLVQDGAKVVGVIGKDKDGKYIKFNAKKVILATGDYQNNDAMVNRWCPDVADFDKKQYHKTGDGHIMAIAAGAKMENLGHTKMMHDFDSGLMFEEPFLYVNMEGKRFTNEDIQFVYVSNVLKYESAFNGGKNIDANHPNGSKGWYVEIFDNDYPNYANSPVPAESLERFFPEGEAPVGVIDYLRDTYRADTLEELAEKVGVPADALKETVERYNELCDAGYEQDPDRSVLGHPQAHPCFRYRLRYQHQRERTGTQRRRRAYRNPLCSR